MRRIQKALLDDTTLHAIRESATEVRDVRHPSVTGIIEVRLGTSLIIATEYAEGVPLSSVMRAAQRRGRPLAPAVAVRIILELLRMMLDAASALEAAGRARPLFGVCPDAVLVGEGGTIVAADLGLLTLARPPRNPLLMAYRAPEQLGALLEADRRSELFSVGAIWWELLANRSLFGGGDQAAVWQRVRQGSIPPPGAPSDVEALVMTLLERNPQARLGDPEEVLGLVQELGPRHIAGSVRTSEVLAELSSLVERGDFPSIEPPPDLEPRSVRPPRQAATSPRVEAPGPPDGVKLSSEVGAPAVEDVERAPQEGASLQHSFAASPLPNDLPDEDDWGTIEELPSQDLTTLRPSEAAQPASPPVALREADAGMGSGTAQTLVATEQPVVVTSQAGNDAPAGASQARGLREVAATGAGDSVATLEPASAVPGDASESSGGMALDDADGAGGQPDVPEPRLAPVISDAPERELSTSERPTREIDPSELAAVVAGAAAGTSNGPDSGTEAAESLPTFTVKKERPVEEMLSEVLRDAAILSGAAAVTNTTSTVPAPPRASPPTDSNPPGDPPPPVDTEKSTESPAPPDPPVQLRSPMASDSEELSRVSAIENMAAEVRQERQVPTPRDAEPATGTPTSEPHPWLGRLLVGGGFVVSFVAAFFGLRAVLLASGSGESVSASDGRDAIASATPVVSARPVISARPTTSLDAVSSATPSASAAESPAPTESRRAAVSSSRAAVVASPAPLATTEDDSKPAAASAAPPPVEPESPKSEGASSEPEPTSGTEGAVASPPPAAIPSIEP